MTSQHFSDRTERTEASLRRATTARRGLNKRGALPSFGDMILPIVSVFAVVLLVIAGCQFFLNGLKTSPGIATTRAYAEAPAILAELERKADAEDTEKISEAVSLDAAKDKDKKEEEDLFALSVAVQNQKTIPAAVSVKSAPKKQAPAKSTASTSNPEPKKTQAQPKKAASGTVSSKQWRIQVGAYTTRAGAQEAADKIKKAGYSSTVYSNPASKHFKVWVAGGADKKTADNVVKAMQKLGYKGSFSFPPAK